MSASLAVQIALRAALEGIAPVFDAVPVSSPAPYLTIGPDGMTDWSTKTSRGREHRVAIGVWDDASGRGRVKTLLGQIETAVLALSGEQAGWRIAHVLFVRSFVERDPSPDSGGWSHGVAEFRVRTEMV